MTKRILFNQFFTPSSINTFLVNLSTLKSPSLICDFSMGEGSLLLAAKDKWPSALLLGNDVDEECLVKTRNLIPELISYNYDFSSDIFVNEVSNKYFNIDLCVGNPPFKLIRNTECTKQVLKDFGFNSYAELKNIPIEIIFILLCIRLTKNGGEVISILSDSIFVNDKWKFFRTFLISNFNIQIVELPQKTFSFTEAKTHILVLKKIAPVKSIKLCTINDPDNFKLISVEDAAARMDYSYYSAYNQFINSPHTIPNLKIIRGRPINKPLLKHPNFLHTTDFIEDFQIFAVHNQAPIQLDETAYKVAKPGDIIIPRVGTRCLGKVGYVKNGYFAISDCLFILRTDSISCQKKILTTLQSHEGRSWIKSISKGVAARHITVGDLKKLPLSVKRSTA